ncbi:CYTH domain-containing protein [Lactobacillus equicursoris]|uniref:CYTH domain-containing protein n=1 Tax=Lactobacillus equicursoris TaxID=420645 RepID=UPI003992EA2D
MSKNREIEAKVALTQESYEQIAAAYPVKADFQQKNTYFDTPDEILKVHHNALRIRTFKDRAEETIKVPEAQKLQEKYHESLEINDDLTCEEAESYLAKGQVYLGGNVGSFLKENYPSDVDKLRSFTWSQTHRLLLNGPFDCEITLDQTSYPDGFSDYEMEIENDDPALIKDCLAQLKDHFKLEIATTNNMSKIARASLHAGN